jgi:hypothetical protein
MEYDVPLFAQTSAMSCWAACIAMILGWKNGQSIADVTIAANPGGPSYMPQFQNGLDPNDRYILERNGFRLDAPMCYTPERVSDTMQAHGPLWVASLVPLGTPPRPSPHIRVVRGIDGDKVLVNDPWPVGAGARYMRAFDRFFGRMEGLGAREMSQPAPIYVAYLEDAR